MKYLGPQDLGQSFSHYGPPCRQITYMYNIHLSQETVIYTVYRNIGRLFWGGIGVIFRNQITSFVWNQISRPFTTKYGVLHTGTALSSWLSREAILAAGTCFSSGGSREKARGARAPLLILGKEKRRNHKKKEEKPTRKAKQNRRYKTI